MITDVVYRYLRRSPTIQNQFRRLVRRLPHRQRRVQHFGQFLDVDPSELHGFYLYYEHEYDDYIFTFLSSRLERYERALDIGANIGIYTVFFGARLAEVDAFEPEPSVLPRLRNNLRLNALNNVRIHEICIAHENTTVTFLQPDYSNQGVGRILTGQPDGVKLEAITLDYFLGGPCSTPIIVKIDVEGAEWLVAQGCTESLGKRTALVNVLLEIHPDQIESLGGSPSRLQQLLADMDFEVRALTPAGLVSAQLESKYRFWWASDRRYPSIEAPV